MRQVPGFWAHGSRINPVEHSVSRRVFSCVPLVASARELGLESAWRRGKLRSSRVGSLVGRGARAVFTRSLRKRLLPILINQPTVGAAYPQESGD